MSRSEETMEDSEKWSTDSVAAIYRQNVVYASRMIFAAKRSRYVLEPLTGREMRGEYRIQCPRPQRDCR